MKTLLLAAAIAAISFSAQAGSMTCNTFGSQQTCSGSNGYSATQNTFGSQTTGRDSLGNSWTTNRFGDQTTTSFQPGYRRGW